MTTNAYALVKLWGGQLWEPWNNLGNFGTWIREYVHTHAQQEKPQVAEIKLSCQILIYPLHFTSSWGLSLNEEKHSFKLQC